MEQRWNNCINPLCPNKHPEFDMVLVPIRKDGSKKVEMCKACADEHLSRRKAGVVTPD